MFMGTFFGSVIALRLYSKKNHEKVKSSDSRNCLHLNNWARPFPRVWKVYFPGPVKSTGHYVIEDYSLHLLMRLLVYAAFLRCLQ